MATQNTGQQGFKILEGIYLDDNELTGFKKPNMAQNSPQVLVPESTTMTVNYPDDIAPTGGANGDIWCNINADEQFKKISGTWTLLTDRVTNDDYVAPAENLTDCPLPE